MTTGAYSCKLRRCPHQDGDYCYSCVYALLASVASCEMPHATTRWPLLLRSEHCKCRRLGLVWGVAQLWVDVLILAGE